MCEHGLIGACAICDGGGQVPETIEELVAEGSLPAKAQFCNGYYGSPSDCMHEVFESGDGGTRCAGCHLYPDQCTCGSVGLRLIETLGVL